MGTINRQLACKPDTAYLRKIIENSLLADWEIRIEYAGAQTGTTAWLCWDKVFAIRSSDTVLQAIQDCYLANPEHVIRLNAQKFRPQTSMLYTVYTPPVINAETINEINAVSIPLRKKQPSSSLPGAYVS